MLFLFLFFIFMFVFIYIHIKGLEFIIISFLNMSQFLTLNSVFARFKHQFQILWLRILISHHGFDRFSVISNLGWVHLSDLLFGVTHAKFLQNTIRTHTIFTFNMMLCNLIKTFNILLWIIHNTIIQSINKMNLTILIHLRIINNLTLIHINLILFTYIIITVSFIF